MSLYIPENKEYPYPEKTDQHYGIFKMNRGIIFDKDYPYVDNSRSFKFKRFWVRLLCRIIVFPFMVPPKTGLKIVGKKNIKKYKEELKNGFVTVSNHVHDWDYLCIMKALHNFRWPNTLSIGYCNPCRASGQPDPCRPLYKDLKYSSTDRITLQMISVSVVTTPVSRE